MLLSQKDGSDCVRKSWSYLFEFWKLDDTIYRIIIHLLCIEGIVFISYICSNLITPSLYTDCTDTILFVSKIPKWQTLFSVL